MSKGNPAERLEDELDRAKARGRWLSDDEQLHLIVKLMSKPFWWRPSNSVIAS